MVQFENVTNGEPEQRVVTRESVRNLIRQKDEIEAEIAELTAALEASPVGLRGPLVDREGYPRSDVDIPLIRTQRNRLACLYTDHKEIMKQIDKDMAQLHADEKRRREEQKSQQQQQPMDVDSVSTGSTSNNNNNNTTTATTGDQDQQREYESLKGFLLVNDVSAGSPAEEAGLKKGDIILKIGNITHTNPYGLQAVASLVKSSVNSQIRVVVRRTGATGPVVLSLTPHTWSGAGLLGCHLLPHSE